MSITTGKRGHVNICASALTPLAPLPLWNRGEKSKMREFSCPLCVLNWSKTYIPPLSCLIFTNSGKQLIIKPVHFQQHLEARVPTLLLLNCFDMLYISPVLM